MNNFLFLDIETIEGQSGCKKKCHYYEYSSVREYVINDKAMTNRSEIWLEILLASSKIKVKEETLIFPLRSFISEFGGALGLFLGFSFMMIWDGIEALLTKSVNFLQNKLKF